MITMMMPRSRSTESSRGRTCATLTVLGASGATSESVPTSGNGYLNFLRSLATRLSAVNHKRRGNHRAQIYRIGREDLTIVQHYGWMTAGHASAQDWRVLLGIAEDSPASERMLSKSTVHRVKSAE